MSSASPASEFSDRRPASAGFRLAPATFAAASRRLGHSGRWRLRVRNVILVLIVGVGDRGCVSPPWRAALQLC